MGCNCNKIDKCKSRGCTGCPVKDLYANCVNLALGSLPCSGINANDTLDNVLIKIDQHICDKFDSITGFGALINVGGGAEIYKGNSTTGQKQIRSLTSTNNSVDITENENTIDIVVPIVDVSPPDYKPIYLGYNSGNHEFAGLKSTSLSLTEDPAGNLQIEYPPVFVDVNEVPRLIVNNNYTGDEETGSVAQPFKTITAAINEFVGTGTRNSPELEGASIVIQNGDPYTYTGDFSYRNINIIIEPGAFVNHQPSSGVWFMDLDMLDDANCENTLEMGATSELRLYQKGFRNKGGLSGTSVKRINITGSKSANIIIDGVKDETYPMFEINVEGTPGYGHSGGEIEVEGVIIRSWKGPLIRQGDPGSGGMRIVNSHFRAGGVTTTITDKFYILGGGDTTFEGTLLVWNHNNTTAEGFTITKGNLSFSRCIFQAQAGPSTLIVNKSTNGIDPPKVKMEYCSNRYGPIDTIFDSEGKWYNVYPNYNIFENVNNLNGLNINLAGDANDKAAHNIVDNIILEALPIYMDRAAAALSLKKDSKFINKNNSAAETDWTLDIVL